MLRVIVALLLVIGLALPLSAQETAPEPDRLATGGAQTLEDILARQRGEQVDNDFRRSDTGDPDSAAGISSQLGTLGGASDPELWRALRFGIADVTASNNGPASTVLVQDGGMRWLQFREGPLIEYGGYLLLGTIVLLAVFFLIRGRIRVDGEKTGRMVVRFEAFERFSHWLLAGSFLLLGFTGLISLMGRKFLIPTFGHDAFSTIAIGSKWIHNNVSWAFMIALVSVFVLWVVHNLPSRSDVKWIMQGGGILKKGIHPPAKKFNAGQKLIFWAVIIFGASISVSGLSLLFPFEMPLFAATFAKLNALGVPGLIGMEAFPTALSPQEEMQLAQLWHAIVAFVLMAIIIAHIYIGTLGMEGASDAMVTGLVEEQWAKEHHSIWYEKLEDAGKASGAAHTPAEQNMFRSAGLLVLLTVTNPAVGQETDTLTGHGGAILDIAVADDGRMATGSFDNSVGLWDGKSPTWLEGHDAAVTAVEFLGNGDLVSAGDDFALMVWNGVEAELLGHHKGKITDIAEGPDGTIATSSWDGTIGIWENRRPPVWLEGHTSGVNAVSYMSDNTLLSAGADGALRVWDITDGSNRVVYNHGFGIHVLEVAADRVIIGTVDGKTVAFDLKNWQPLAEFGADRDPVLGLAVSPVQTRIATGNGAGKITVISLQTLEIEREFIATVNGPVWALAFDGNGHLLAGGLDHRVFFWPLDTEPPHTLMATNTQSNVPVSNGARQFQRKCAVCHTLTKERDRRAGPALGGLFGRKAGSTPDYPYSATLANSDIIWDADTIDALFDEGPDHYIPGSRMPMQRITGLEDRQDLIAWLRDATALTEE